MLSGPETESMAAAVGETRVTVAVGIGDDHAVGQGVGEGQGVLRPSLAHSGSPRNPSAASDSRVNPRRSPYRRWARAEA